jgi:PAS domain S-box-containing protein
LLAATLRSIGDAVIATDAAGCVELMNPVAEALTGWSAGEALGIPLHEVFRIVEEETRAEVESPVARVLREGTVQGLGNHTLLLARDGTERPIADSGAPIRGEQGELIGVVLVFRDQTRERAEQRALAASLARHRALLAAVPDIVMEVDARKVYTWANESGLRFFGPDVVGHEAAEYFEGEQDTYARVAPLFAGDEQTFYVESWQRRQDGERRLLGWWCRVLRDGTGAVSGALSTARDLTERQQSEAMLALFVKHSPIYAFIKDVTPSESRVIVASENCQDMIGVPGSEMAGKTMAELFPPDFAAKITADDRDVVARGEVLRLDEDLGGRHYTTIKYPLRLGDRTLLAGYTIDITDRRRAEEERRDLQAKLAQSGRLASMGLLAAGVAHEINNPLAYVLYNLESLATDLPGFVDPLRRRHEALIAHLGVETADRVLGPTLQAMSPLALDDVLDRLRDAVEGAQRIREIARGLATFARADRCDVAPIDLRVSLAYALRMAMNEIRFRARVVQDLGPVPLVLATDGKLAQVFLNLLINAAHAIDEGDVDRNEIRVRTWTEGGRACVEVSDTGRGIPEEHRSRLFEPFFTTREVGAGTGLGLPICRNLVSAFGGEIRFTTEVGQGSRFRVDLPAAPLDWGRAREPASPDAQTSPAERGRVLVIDDEPGIRSILLRLLGQDHEVVAAASGEVARELLREDRRFDVIYCDLMMPGLSGMELHAWLAGVDPELAARVVFITGGVFTPGASEYLARVPNRRVEKPFESEGLRRLTRELVTAAGPRPDRLPPG